MRAVRNVAKNDVIELNSIIPPLNYNVEQLKIDTQFTNNMWSNIEKYIIQLADFVQTNRDRSFNMIGECIDAWNENRKTNITEPIATVTTDYYSGEESVIEDNIYRGAVDSATRGEITVTAPEPLNQNLTDSQKIEQVAEIINSVTETGAIVIPDEIAVTPEPEPTVIEPESEPMAEKPTNLDTAVETANEVVRETTTAAEAPTVVNRETVTERENAVRSGEAAAVDVGINLDDFADVFNAIQEIQNSAVETAATTNEISNIEGAVSLAAGVGTAGVIATVTGGSAVVIGVGVAIAAAGLINEGLKRAGVVEKNYVEEGAKAVVNKLSDGLRSFGNSIHERFRNDPTDSNPVNIDRTETGANSESITETRERQETERQQRDIEIERERRDEIRENLEKTGLVDPDYVFPDGETWVDKMYNGLEQRGWNDGRDNTGNSGETVNPGRDSDLDDDHI